MPKGKNQHVVPSQTGKGWDVKPAGEQPSSHHRTQVNAAKQAVSNAKQQKTEVLIHGRNGQIRSNDPKSIKDTEH